MSCTFFCSVDFFFDLIELMIAQPFSLNPNILYPVISVIIFIRILIYFVCIVLSICSQVVLKICKVSKNSLRSKIRFFFYPLWTILSDSIVFRSLNMLLIVIFCRRCRYVVPRRICCTNAWTELGQYANAPDWNHNITEPFTWPTRVT